jgi:hypothetical protein
LSYKEFIKSLQWKCDKLSRKMKWKVERKRTMKERNKMMKGNKKISGRVEERERGEPEYCHVYECDYRRGLDW